MSDLVERLLARAPYYEDWARDIRNMNGHSVDADHADATARDLREAAAALSRAEAERALRERAFKCELHPDVDPHRSWGCPDCMAEARRLLSRAEAEREKKYSGPALERVAQVLYEDDPFYESGEAVDGFQVSPGGYMSWGHAVSLANEFGGEYAAALDEYRARARAAILAFLNPEDTTLVETMARASIDAARLHDRVSDHPMTDAEWIDLWGWPAHASMRGHYERQARAQIAALTAFLSSARVERET